MTKRDSPVRGHDCLTLTIGKVTVEIHYRRLIMHLNTQFAHMHHTRNGRL